MHSLRASIVFIAITVFAFLADHRRVEPSVTPRPDETVPAQVALENPAPVQPEVEGVDKQKPSKKKKTRVTRVVKATAYNADPEQTDDTPDVCAWGDKIRPGIIAISRDLEKSGLTRGKEVYIEGIGNVVVMDRMHPRKRNQIDLYMENHEDAVEFGVKELTIYWTEDPHIGQES